MYKVTIAATLLIAMGVPALGSKLQGSTTLKDSQPTGTVDKQHKHQAYDLSFDALGKQYTCRTNPSKSMKATDFVVGSDVTYEIDGDKAKVKTPQGKEVQCKVVRVEGSPSPKQ
jgi:uncharacterized protein YcfJ